MRQGGIVVFYCPDLSRARDCVVLRDTRSAPFYFVGQGHRDVPRHLY